MSLLQQNKTESDDASRGEELTKGTSRIGMAVVIAAIVVTLAMTAYVVSGRKPPVATGEVTSVTAHIMHRETSEFDAGGAAKPKEQFDQVLLFTHLRVHNQSKQPVTVHNIMANITLADGIHSSSAASAGDYERLFQFSPELVSLHGKALPSEASIPAGQTLEGDFIAAFRISKQEWDSRKNLDFTVSIPYQPSLKLTPASPVAVQ